MASLVFSHTHHDSLSKSQICLSLRQDDEHINELVHEIFNNVVCATSKGSDHPTHTRSLIRVCASRLNIL